MPGVLVAPLLSEDCNGDIWETDDRLLCWARISWRGRRQLTATVSGWWPSIPAIPCA